MTGALPARDLVDVRLSAAISDRGCAICGVRRRSETAALDAIIAERVLDLRFREAWSVITASAGGTPPLSWRPIGGHPAASARRSSTGR